MKTQNFQAKLDIIIYSIFGKFISKKITPNHLTIARFFLIPILFITLLSGNYIAGFIIFVVAASTDFLDGTLARKRNQITDIGKVIDPIADKLLIGTMLYFVGTEHIIVKIFLAVILFEIIAVLFSGFGYKIIGRPIGANVFGKIKMVLQSFSIGGFLLGSIINNKTLLDISMAILVVALFFAVLAGLEQTRIRIKKLKSAKK